jgi:protein tyrosine phosphatase
VYDTKKKVTIQSNGGTLMARKLATIQGYQHKVWFDKQAITNILSLANVSKQYRVTSDSGNSKGFIVHRDTAGLTDMHFRLHDLGLHVYNPKLEQLSFLNTAQDNMEGFTKRQLEGAEMAKQLY